jgi:hypothetical protein
MCPSMCLAWTSRGWLKDLVDAFVQEVDKFGYVCIVGGYGFM